MFKISVFPGAQTCAFWRNFGLNVPENIPRRATRGAIFVRSKRPGIFGPVFSSRLPVLVTPSVVTMIESNRKLKKVVQVGDNPLCCPGIDCR